MRKIVLTLAALGGIAALGTAPAAKADTPPPEPLVHKAQYYVQYGHYDYCDWRCRAWRHHEWREHEWREHRWRERHEWHEGW